MRYRGNPTGPVGLTGPLFAPDGVVSPSLTPDLTPAPAPLGERLRLAWPDAPLAIETFDSVAALGPTGSAWDRLIAATGSDVYFTTPWLEAWAAHYGDGRQFRLLLMRAAGQPIAALPFVITRHTLPVPARIASFMGAQHTIPVFRPAIRPGFERAALGAALERLFAEGADAVSLTPLSGEDEALAEAARDLAGKGSATLIRDEAALSHTVFALPPSLDDWLASLDKRRRANWRRDARLLEAETGAVASVAHGEDAAPAFERFAEMHTRQWRRAGLPGHFGDWPGALGFNRDLVARFAAPDAPGRVAFHEIRDRAGGLLSSQFVFSLGRSACWRLPARRPEAEYDRLGLGRIGLGRMIGALGEAGVTRIEAGPGHYDYKLKHGGVEHDLRRMVLATPESSARVRRLLAWARALHLGYHRAWYARGALRLAALTGRPRPAVARAWIRTRL